MQHSTMNTANAPTNRKQKEKNRGGATDCKMDSDERKNKWTMKL